MKINILLLMVSCCISIAVAQPQPRYPLTDPKQATIFSELSHELRCLVCQNQNLADSNAPLAEDLRRKIHRLLEQGYTKQQVLDYLKNRYGNFVHFNPPWQPDTYLLWLLPAVFVLFGSGILYYLTQRSTS